MLFGNCLHLAAVQTQSHSSIGASCQEMPRRENKKLPAENSGSVPYGTVREDDGKYFPRKLRAEITNL